MQKTINKKGLNYVIFMVSLLIIFLVSLLTGYIIGFRYNGTPSMDKGWYLIEKNKRPAVGQVAIFCPPLNGKKLKFLPVGGCEDGTAPHIKRLVAGPGDLVQVKPEAVYVNGVKLKGSKPIIRIDLPRIYGNYKLGKNQFWGYGEGLPEKSFDSRYYGIISGDTIKVLRYLN